LAKQGVRFVEQRTRGSCSPLAAIVAVDRDTQYGLRLTGARQRTQQMLSPRPLYGKFRTRNAQRHIRDRAHQLFGQGSIPPPNRIRERP
jgi:hypothetical protein